MTMHARIGHNNPPRWPTGSIFPPNTHALIYRPARSATTSGKANTDRWVLRFERRSPQFVEPLMGWTGGEDMLTQVELSFPTREAAVAYAERQGLSYTVREPAAAHHIHKRAKSSSAAGAELPTRPRVGPTEPVARSMHAAGEVRSAA